MAVTVKFNGKVLKALDKVMFDDGVHGAQECYFRGMSSKGIALTVVGHSKWWKYATPGTQGFEVVSDKAVAKAKAPKVAKAVTKPAKASKSKEVSASELLEIAKAIALLESKGFKVN